MSVGWPTPAAPGGGDLEFLDAGHPDNPDQVLEPASLAADNQTGFSRVRDDYGFYGAGQTVAVIDSGVAWDHPALGGGWGTSQRVVGGWDFTPERDANPYDDGPAGGHGTHVAGIIGSSAPQALGVAPQVDLVALRVFDDRGQGNFDWVEQALTWVHHHRLDYRYPITTVNLSLGGNWNGSAPPRWAMLENELEQLHRDGVFVSVAAGNAFSQFAVPGLSYPAASPWVMPVMSTNADGSLSSYSQRASTALAAPGRSIYSTVPDYLGNQNHQPDDFARLSGTSMAAPYVAGAAVVLREAMAFCDWVGINEDLISRTMFETADVLYDPATRQSYRRLNLDRALGRIMPGDDYGSDASHAFDLGQLTQQLVEIGTIARVSDHDTFSFVAGQTGTAALRTFAIDRLEPRWQVVGTPTTDRQGQLTFQVTAGQRYTLDLSTAAGIGRYSFWVDFQPPVVGALTQTSSTGAISSTAGPARSAGEIPFGGDLNLPMIGPLQLSVSNTSTVMRFEHEPKTNYPTATADREQWPPERADFALAQSVASLRAISAADPNRWTEADTNADSPLQGRVARPGTRGGATSRAATLRLAEVSVQACDWIWARWDANG